MNKTDDLRIKKIEEDIQRLNDIYKQIIDDILERDKATPFQID